MPPAITIPTYETLGPDPEPLGIRADVMLHRVAEAEILRSGGIPCLPR
jgi:hypothetical protein